MSVLLTNTNPCIEDEKNSRYWDGSGIESTYCREFLCLDGFVAAVIVSVGPFLNPVEFGQDGTSLPVISIQSVRPVSVNVYRIVICYNHPESSQNDPDEADDISFSIDVGSEQQLLLSSFNTKCFSANSQTESTNGEIIFDENCKVVGCPVIIPRKQYCETVFLPPGGINVTYCNNLAATVGTVNQFNYRGFDPKTMLLTSAVGSKPRPDAKWQLNLCWSISPNITRLFEVFLAALESGGVTTQTVSVDINGWDAFKPIPHKFQDGPTCSLIYEKIKVHQVYRNSDYATNLGF